MCDGHIVYQGKASDSSTYFKNINIPLPRFANPADFYMKILTINYPKQSNDEMKIEFMVNNYKSKCLPRLQ